ncbi:MAG: PAS domain S-box protein, partial [Terriglobia bacterium]
QLIGLLNLESTEVDGFPPAIRQLLLSLADSLAIAIDTTRAHEVAHLRANRMALLAEVSGRVSAGLSVSAVLSSILHATGDLFPQWEPGMWLLEPDTQLLRLCVLDPAGTQIVETDLRVPLGTGLTGSVAAQGEVVTTEDISTDPRLRPEMLENILRRNWHGYAAVPLRAEGKILGVLRVASHERRSFTPGEKHLLVTLAHQAAWPLARAKLIEELEESRARLEERTAYLNALIENSPLAIVVSSAQQQVQLCNPAFERLFLYRLEEIAGSNIDEFIAPEDKWAEPAEFTRRVLAGETLHAATHRRRKDGTSVDVELYCVPLIVHGQLNGVIVLYQDITERKQAEKKLEERTAYLNALIENSPLAILAHNAQHRVQLCNPAFERLFLYRQAEIVGRDTDTLIAPEETPSEAADFTRRVLAGETVHVTTRRRRKDGTLVDVELYNVPLMTDGELRGVYALYQDISERKRAEQALQQSKELLVAILEASRDGVVVEENETIAYANSSFARLYGYAEAEELLGQHVSVVQAAEDDKRMLEFGRKRLRGELTPSTYEFKGKRKDGTKIDLEASVSPSTIAGKSSIVAVIRDISERKRAEEELRQTAAELARSNTELEQFASVASHDLQEPLRMVASYGELLARRYRGKLDPDANEFITYITDGAARMQQLIEALLALSRVSTRGEPFQAVNLSAVIQRALRNLEGALRESRAEVVVTAMPTVVGDAAQLTQLFQNLISNAIKFRAQEPPRIHASAERNGNEWVLRVRDNGIGIDMQHADRIFRLFQRLHSKTEYVGTGIGLAICKKVVERHGGRIWVESKPGQGSTFRFTLPEKGVQKA